ncbi:MAG: hypothetical protein HY939_03865 [Gammaproteobacteria bacterium]|nr:hypothetical protein [Gammaproteobacteria bacterium]
MARGSRRGSRSRLSGSAEGVVLSSTPAPPVVQPPSPEEIFQSQRQAFIDRYSLAPVAWQLINQSFTSHYPPSSQFPRNDFTFQERPFTHPGWLEHFVELRRRIIQKTTGGGVQKQILTDLLELNRTWASYFEKHCFLSGDDKLEVMACECLRKVLEMEPFDAVSPLISAKCNKLLAESYQFFYEKYNASLSDGAEDENYRARRQSFFRRLHAYLIYEINAGCKNEKTKPLRTWLTEIKLDETLTNSQFEYIAALFSGDPLSIKSDVVVKYIEGLAKEREDELLEEVKKQCRSLLLRAPDAVSDGNSPFQKILESIRKKTGIKEFLAVEVRVISEMSSPSGSLEKVDELLKQLFSVEKDRSVVEKHKDNSYFFVRLLNGWGMENAVQREKITSDRLALFLEKILRFPCEGMSDDDKASIVKTKLVVLEAMSKQFLAYIQHVLKNGDVSRKDAENALTLSRFFSILSDLPRMGLSGGDHQRAVTIITDMEAGIHAALDEAVYKEIQDSAEKQKYLLSVSEFFKKVGKGFYYWGEQWHPQLPSEELVRAMDEFICQKMEAFSDDDFLMVLARLNNMSSRIEEFRRNNEAAEQGYQQAKENGAPGADDLLVVKRTHKTLFDILCFQDAVFEELLQKRYQFFSALEKRLDRVPDGLLKTNILLYFKGRQSLREDSIKRRANGEFRVLLCEAMQSKKSDGIADCAERLNYSDKAPVIIQFLERNVLQIEDYTHLLETLIPCLFGNPVEQLAIREEVKSWVFEKSRLLEVNDFKEVEKELERFSRGLEQEEGVKFKLSLSWVRAKEIGKIVPASKLDSLLSLSRQVLRQPCHNASVGFYAVLLHAFVLGMYDDAHNKTGLACFSSLEQAKAVLEIAENYMVCFLQENLTHPTMRTNLEKLYCFLESKCEMKEVVSKLTQDLGLLGHELLLKMEEKLKGENASWDEVLSTLRSFGELFHGHSQRIELAANHQAQLLLLIKELFRRELAVDRASALRKMEEVYRVLPDFEDASFRKIKTWMNNDKEYGFSRLDEIVSTFKRDFSAEIPVSLSQYLDSDFLMLMGMGLQRTEQEELLLFLQERKQYFISMGCKLMPQIMDGICLAIYGGGRNVSAVESYLMLEELGLEKRRSIDLEIVRACGNETQKQKVDKLEEAYLNNQGSTALNRLMTLLFEVPLEMAKTIKYLSSLWEFATQNLLEKVKEKISISWDALDENEKAMVWISWHDLKRQVNDDRVNDLLELTSAEQEQQLVHIKQSLSYEKKKILVLSLKDKKMQQVPWEKLNGVRLELGRTLSTLMQEGEKEGSLKEQLAKHQMLTRVMNFLAGALSQPLSSREGLAALYNRLFETAVMLNYFKEVLAREKDGLGFLDKKNYCGQLSKYIDKTWHHLNDAWNNIAKLFNEMPHDITKQATAVFVDDLHRTLGNPQDWSVFYSNIRKLMASSCNTSSEPVFHALVLKDVPTPPSSVVVEAARESMAGLGKHPNTLFAAAPRRSLVSPAARSQGSPDIEPGSYQSRRLARS